ncbi:glycosyltransferase family 2 protein [Reichenbachiella versicolor]|uniref:glycosyltransferase family 2 protein n=1 Tax=Reichenbachiella versicolor TaxID=1821036 RepID=UPI000D6E0253|nr:glycosyltransferase [Reichenbachiella versicolor]
MNNPKFTILLASYNRLELLKASLKSSLSQDFEDYEVLIVDDGSEQETVNYIKELESHEQRLRAVYQRNQGVAVARQNGLLSANGQYIVILDSDDTLDVNTLLRLDLHLSREKSDLVYVNNREVFNQRVRVSNYPKYISNQQMINAIFLRPRVPFKHSGTTFLKSKAIEIGGYDVNLRIKIDIDFFLKFLNTENKVSLLDETLVTFLLHKRSISKSRFKGILVWWRLVDKYGGRSKMNLMCYKFVRAFIEVGKYIFLKFS